MSNLPCSVVVDMANIKRVVYRADSNQAHVQEVGASHLPQQQQQSSESLSAV
jgi:hypothetical protein